MKDVLEKAKIIISEEVEKEGFKVKQIFLFGSRARGDFNKESDWDFFVVLDRDISFQQLKKIVGRIQLRLVEEGIPSDVILRGENQFNEARKSVGNLSYYVAQEGILI